MNQISVVIIGMGRMGRTRYHGMKKHGGFKVLGLCDVNVDSLSEFPEKKYTEWKKCIDECNPEAVVVCTYNAIIPDIVCYSIERKKHVFSEKPPGRTLEDVKKMKYSLDKNPQCVLKFAFNHRYHGSIVEAKALIDSGMIGEIVCARGVYGKAGSQNFVGEWRNNKELSGGGILIDQGIHLIDLLCYFMGDFTEVQSTVDNLVWKDIDGEDSAFAILKNKNGLVAALHSSATQWRHKFNLEIICTDGNIKLSGLRTSTNSYGEERITYYKKDLEEKTGGLGKPLGHTLCFNSDPSWDCEHEEFYNALRLHEKIIHGSIDDAMRVMKIVYRIYNGNIRNHNKSNEKKDGFSPIRLNDSNLI